MNKTLSYILGGLIAIFGGISLIQMVNATAYPYPQNYTLDQRRFDQQQAANLVMRRLQPSTTGQWAIGIVDVTGGSSGGLTISTATYGTLTSTGTVVITPGYGVKKFSLLSIGGLTTMTTNKTDGVLTLDDGMGFEQSFDFPVTLSLTVNFSTGAVYYAITGVK